MQKTKPRRQTSMAENRELTVLVRSHPEEAVLTMCKTPTTPVNTKQKPTCSAVGCKRNDPILITFPDVP